MPLALLITGGQTGADQGAWRAARSRGIRTFGWMPRHFRTDDGYHPEFATLYGAREHASDAYGPRTDANVAESDVVFWIGHASPGLGRTLKSSRKHRRPFVVAWRSICDSPEHSPEAIASHCLRSVFSRIMIAGNRESRHHGIGLAVESYVTAMIDHLLADSS